VKNSKINERKIDPKLTHSNQKVKVQIKDSNPTHNQSKSSKSI
jgi:hypothetical protein